MRIRNLFGDWIFYRGALAIAIPVMLQQLIQNLVSLVDNFMVSGLGDISMSGVNVSNQILFVFQIFVNAICISGGIYLTQNYGAGEREGMQQAFRFKLFAGLSSVIVFYIVCRAFPRQILGLMLIGNSQASLILDQSVAYARLIFFMSVPMILSMCIATSLRDIGQVKLPLFISSGAALINTFLNWVFIYGNLGAPRMEVRGAAIATITARVIELIMYLIAIQIIRPEFTFKITRLFDINIGLNKEIAKASAMLLVSEMTWVLAETITTALYNGRGGAEVVSGMAAGFAIANLMFVAFGGVQSAIIVVLGSTLGAGRLDEARKQKTWLLSGTFVLGILMMFMALASTLLVPLVFGRLSSEANEITREVIILIALFMPVWLYLLGQLAVSRAGGDTAMGAVADALITVLVMVPGVIALALFTDTGPIGLYAYVRSVDFIRLIAFHFWLKREAWLKNLTEQS